MFREGARIPVMVWFLALGTAMALLIAGCAQPVTLHHEPVTNEAVIVAAQTVHTVELGAVILGGFLIGARERACGDMASTLRGSPLCAKLTKALTEYEELYAPRVRDAIRLAKAALRVLARAPTDTTADRIKTVLEALEAAYDDVKAWGVLQGWGG